MVDFKKLDTSDTSEHDDEAEQQSNEFAALYKESLKERPERDKIIEGTVVRIDSTRKPCLWISALSRKDMWRPTSFGMPMARLRFRSESASRCS